MSPTYYINGRFLTQEATGVQRYAEELVKALDLMIDTGDIDTGGMIFQLLVPRAASRHLDLKHIACRAVGRFSGHLWEQLELPWYARGGFLINLCNAAPVLKRRQIVTVHDAGVFARPESYSFAFRLWYRVLLFCLGRIARQIITDSDFSSRELDRHLHVPRSRIRSIPLGREHISAIPPQDYIVERAGLSGRPYLLGVSSLSPRKNFRALIKAVELLGPADFDIVIAGGTNPRIFGSQNAHLPEGPKYLGYVTDGELKSLYHHATAFIYPSLYEGFGLPPLEAMTCGCPVIVSDIPPHREVCGDAALYCNPNDVADIADKIRLMMTDDKLRRRLTVMGRNRAEIFSWRTTAGRVARLLEDDLALR